MKKTITVFSLIILTSLLSFNIDWFNYILLLIIALAVIFLVIIGLISIFKKQKGTIFKVPLWIILICIAGIITSLFSPYDPATINTDDLSENLEYAYKTDQRDRKELKSFVGFFSKLKERDSIRLKLVKRNYSQLKTSKPIDKFHAAFIFHHSDNSNDYKVASQLAAQAASSEKLKDNYVVQWLKKASYDRYMLSIGKPEKYNTQNKFSVDLN